jgi:tetratricopeptide (TPR) repeat protein
MWRLVKGLLAVPLLMFVLVCVYSKPIGVAVLGNTVLFVVIWAASMVLHEVGHVVVARLVGLQVPRLDLGVGKRVGSVRVGATMVHVNSVPLSGFTHLAATNKQYLRLRLWLAVAGGPLVSLALLLAARGLGNVGNQNAVVLSLDFGSKLLAWEFVVSVNMLILVTSLEPISMLLVSQSRSDGARLLQIPFSSQKYMDNEMHSALVVDVDALVAEKNFAAAEALLEPALRAENPPWIVRLSTAVMLSFRGDNAAALSMYGALCAERDLTTFQRAMLQNNIAWATFCLRNEALRNEANANSAAAYKAAPRQAAILGTRGAVLGWMGQHREAIKLLKVAYARNSGPQSRALNACCLVLSYVALNDVNAAVTWLARAEKADSTSLLLPEAKAVLQAALKASSV